MLSMSAIFFIFVPQLHPLVAQLALIEFRAYTHGLVCEFDSEEKAVHFLLKLVWSKSQHQMEAKVKVQR